MMGSYGAGMGVGAWLAMGAFWLMLLAVVAWLVARLLPTSQGRPPMNTNRRTAMIVSLVFALVAVVGSVAYAATADSHAPGHSSRAAIMGGDGSVGTFPGSMMGSDSMMGPGMGQLWLVGDGSPVTSIASGRARATLAASAAGLHPGEIIWFDNGFYVELKDPTGEAATEVIVDPNTGAVTTEPGPAMMWNTSSGMHGGSGATNESVSSAQAQTIAQKRLDANQAGLSVASVDAYPGYFTVDIARSGTLTGMLSVNARSGQVWLHSWHGRFIAKEDR